MACFILCHLYLCWIINASHLSYLVVQGWAMHQCDTLFTYQFYTLCRLIVEICHCGLLFVFDVVIMLLLYVNDHWFLVIM